MTRTWNPEWQDLTTVEFTRQALRQAILASVNWVEDHIELVPLWPAATFPKPMFDTITEACDDPTPVIVDVAIVCGMYVRNEGWEAFDIYMRTMGMNPN